MSEVVAVTSVLVRDGVIVEGAGLVPLTGGVSSDVWRIAPEDQTERYRSVSPFGLVVKAPLAQLRVPTTWEVDVSRGRAEAQALRLFGRITPSRVPQLLWQDDDLPAIAMEAAPRDWEEWRTQLSTRLSSSPYVSSTRIERVCTSLGQTLAQWHVRTQDIGALPAVLSTGDRLRDLRTDPFHRASAAELPEVASILNELADELESQRVCVVHGDFSPKNVLVAPPDSSALWVLDAEVAHVGNPALDVAFLSAHLLLKAAWRPELSARLDAGRRAFESAYRAASSLVSTRAWNRQTGAILAARVCGVSRVDYLSEANRQWALSRAIELLSERRDLDSVWSSLDPA